MIRWIECFPVKIQGISDIKYIEAAYAHSMVITNSGNLYAWGEGRDGQLGIGIKRYQKIACFSTRDKKC